MLSNNNQDLKEKLKQAWALSQERLAKKQASGSNQGYVDLHTIPISTDALALVKESKARNLEIAAFAKKNNDLYVAALEPTRPDLVRFLEDLKSQEGLNGKVFLASQDSLEYAWTFYKFVSQNSENLSGRMDIIDGRINEFIARFKNKEAIAKALNETIHSSNVGEVLEIALGGAIALGASDVHFEAEKNGAKIRYRIDGALQEINSAVNDSAYHLVVSRVKLLSGLRINVNKKSQDGRFSFVLGGSSIDLRVSIIPSEYGETIVIRVLDPRVIQLNISDLGMRGDDLIIVQEELKNPHGMILNTGPTGSGKTTTLYAFLRKIQNPEIKIITIEDPIEYHLENIEQTQVDKRKNYNFKTGLEAIMRQDPDVILVGEIRDADTANIAIQAALTGHLVFSTLHTNSASGVIPRLTNLSAPVSSIGPALNLIIAQRLMRRLCQFCKEEKTLSSEEKDRILKAIEKIPNRAKKPDLRKQKIFKAHVGGCKECHQTGYKGRIGIFELLRVAQEIESLIEKNAGEAEINQFAKKQGMVTLQQDALIKVLSGLSSLAELEKVTGALEE